MTEAELKARLHYSPATGAFTWVKTGRRAGTLSSIGYVKLTFAGRAYQAHRLAFLYMTGRMPEKDMDHINHDRADNRWCNLQHVSRAINSKNVVAPNKNNTHGFRGVTARRTGWVATLCVARKKQYLGIFKTPEEAYDAYKKAKRAHFTCMGAHLGDN